MKTSLERVTGSLDCGIQKNLEAAFAIHPEECMALNRGHLREQIQYSVSESSTVNEYEYEYKIINIALDLSTYSLGDEVQKRRILHRMEGFAEVLLPLYDDL